MGVIWDIPEEVVGEPVDADAFHCAVTAEQDAEVVLRAALRELLHEHLPVVGVVHHAPLPDAGAPSWVAADVDSACLTALPALGGSDTNSTRLHAFHL